MANLFDALQGMLGSAQKLDNDTNPQVPQDNTKNNLSSLVDNFNNLQTILNNVNENDEQSLMKEFGDIFSGKEPLDKNIQDIQSILGNIVKRAKTDPSVHKQLKDNLPNSQQDQQPHELLDQYNKLLGQLQNVQQKLKTTQKQ